MEMCSPVTHVWIEQTVRWVEYRLLVHGRTALTKQSKQGDACKSSAVLQKITVSKSNKSRFSVYISVSKSCA